MLKTLNIYRSFLYGFLLASYLFSVFQIPIFELAHLLSHTHQISPTHVKLHSYSTHHDHGHSHNVLQLLDDSNTESEEHSTNTNDLDLKKKAKINTILLANSFVSLQQNSNNFGSPKKPTCLYQTLVIPPPQVYATKFL